MSDDNLSLDELRAKVREELEGLREDIKLENDANKEKLITKIISLSAEVGHEVKKEDIETSDMASLGVLEKQLDRLLAARNDLVSGDPASGHIPRGGSQELSTEEKLERYFRATSLAFGLPVEDTDEYKALCEQVRMEHWAEGLRY